MQATEGTILAPRAGELSAARHQLRRAAPSRARSRRGAEGRREGGREEARRLRAAPDGERPWRGWAVGGASQPQAQQAWEQPRTNAAARISPAPVCARARAAARRCVVRLLGPPWWQAWVAPRGWSRPLAASTPHARTYMDAQATLPSQSTARAVAYADDLRVKD
eukprot:scaffold795_cov375-Prasinococcus_capsulatus_cf.AAC.35